MAVRDLGDLEQELSQLRGGIATVSGRYYAMDRDRRWDRTRKAYAALVEGIGTRVAGANEAVTRSYERGVTDDFIEPSVVVGADGQPLATVADGDAVIYVNFRADRARQLTRAFVEPDFDSFARAPVRDLYFVTMTEYEKGLPVDVAFHSADVEMPLAAVLSQHNLRQFHIAETEKYAHVTYFFNGGREEPWPGEDRLLVASPQVATYDLKPEMSARELTDVLVERLGRGIDDFVLVNYANPDMVGHTGSISAAVAAVETVDECLGRVLAAVEQVGGVAFITADHGNCEIMHDEEMDQPHTAHTCNPVPLVAIHRRFHVRDTHAVGLREGGILADLAPTIIDFMGLSRPDAMTGLDLVVS
jgi:2,3-bisphosphoglycerate-independent phosphoglycerate mutase